MTHRIGDREGQRSVMEPVDDLRHLPGRHLIDAYGGGGFRFGDHGHKGSLLGLPSGMWAWPYASAAELDVAAFAKVLDEADEIDTLLIGMGSDIAGLKPEIRVALRERGVVAEAMATGAAARTWNILVGERRRIAAALIAVP